jgi:hypothetical protein
MIRFLVYFLVLYFTFSVIYSFYLSQFEGRVDAMSSTVGYQAAVMLELFGFDSFAENQDVEKSTYVGIDGFGRVKVIEGCNGLSVMILFGVQAKPLKL